MSKEQDYLQKEQETVRRLYAYICKKESISPVPLIFKNVGKGGAACKFSGHEVIAIEMDLRRIQAGACYCLCHEVAHKIQVVNHANPSHNAPFKREFNRLYKRYQNSKIANQLIF